MAESHLQESWGAVEHVEDCPAERDPCTCGGYVPLADAEKLAAALERVRPIIGSDAVHAKVEQLLAGWRAAHPREETT